MLINDHLRLQSTPHFLVPGLIEVGDSLLLRDLGNFLTPIKPNIMDQNHVYLKNYQNVNLDLIWVFELHNFTLKLPGVYRQKERLSISHMLLWIVVRSWVFCNVIYSQKYAVIETFLDFSFSFWLFKHCNKIMNINQILLGINFKFNTLEISLQIRG